MQPEISPVTEIEGEVQGWLQGSEEFKGMNPDFWVEIAVRQCLNAGVDTPMKYILAVRNLESVLVTKLDYEYEAGIIAAEEMLKKEVRADDRPIELAQEKFMQLMKLIDRKRVKEVGGEL